MSRAYSDIAFTPTVRAMQTRMGSRNAYEPLDHTDDRRDALTRKEADFIHARDGFYQATVSETGWPYVQFRGGPTGFLKVLDAKTIGYADFRGNVQYISVGNLQGNDRVSIILMDYANRRRLKLLGHARLVTESEDPALVARLEMPSYRARVERAVVITIEAYDWNCPQHITPRFTEAEFEPMLAPLRGEIERLNQTLAQLRGSLHASPADGTDRLGKGPLPLQISGIRQLTPRVRAYELRAPDGGDLPAVRAGAHIDLPVRLPNGVASTRRYSISSNPRRRDAYEVAVLLEERGSGGSTAIHRDYRLGMTLHCSLPGNDFELADDDRPVVLVAGGIGITPIKAMAQQLRSAGRAVQLHYAFRSRREAAYLDRLEREFGMAMHTYDGERTNRLDLDALMAGSAAGTVFYACGPQRMLDDLLAAAARQGIDPRNIRHEAFAARAARSGDRAIDVTLQRSRRHVSVAPGQSILEALEAAGVEAPAGCRGGTCGTCAVKAVAGRPEHRDTVLSPAERDQAGLMCICVSRAVGDALTLDL